MRIGNVYEELGTLPHLITEHQLRFGWRRRGSDRLE